MRRWLCVPMIALCLMLTACGTGERDSAADLRQRYLEMKGCTMEAVVSCGQGDTLWTAKLSAVYLPEGESVTTVLEPETIAGVQAKMQGEALELEYEDLCLNAGTLSSEKISPMVGLPRLMRALQTGWLLEESRETWEGIPCLRLTLDESGEQGGKILSTLWLREQDGLPLRGEIAVDEEIIFTAEFTEFSFCDKIKN